MARMWVHISVQLSTRQSNLYIVIPEFNQQWVENCIFDLWLVICGWETLVENTKILSSIHGWLNPQMQNLQVRRAKCIYWKESTCKWTSIFKIMMFKGQQYLTLNKNLFSISRLHFSSYQKGKEQNLLWQFEGWENSQKHWEKYMVSSKHS